MTEDPVFLSLFEAEAIIRIEEARGTIEWSCLEESDAWLNLVNSARRRIREYSWSSPQARW